MIVSFVDSLEEASDQVFCFLAEEDAGFFSG
jgi:hypothetical protein